VTKLPVGTDDELCSASGRWVEIGATLTLILKY